MELPIPVLIHNEQLGLKGASGSLLQIYPEGFYLISTRFGSHLHKVMVPIHETILIQEQPEEVVGGETIEIER